MPIDKQHDKFYFIKTPHKTVLPCSFWNLHEIIFLAQTDTTIGFLSKNKNLINRRKGAKDSKELLVEFVNFHSLKYRTPPYFRLFIRRAKKTSFILANKRSFRIIQEDYHRAFLQNLQWLYSSSANPTGKDFDKEFAIKNCEIIIADKRGLFPAKSSSIFKIRGYRIKKIR